MLLYTQLFVRQYDLSCHLGVHLDVCGCVCVVCVCVCVCRPVCMHVSVNIYETKKGTLVEPEIQWFRDRVSVEG